MTNPDGVCVVEGCRSGGAYFDGETHCHKHAVFLQCPRCGEPGKDIRHGHDCSFALACGMVLANGVRCPVTRIGSDGRCFKHRLDVPLPTRVVRAPGRVAAGVEALPEPGNRGTNRRPPDLSDRPIGVTIRELLSWRFADGLAVRLLVEDLAGDPHPPIPCATDWDCRFAIADRQYGMKRLRMQGYTLEQVGDAFGLSRERVRHETAKPTIYNVSAVSPDVRRKGLNVKVSR